MKKIRVCFFVVLMLIITLIHTSCYQYELSGIEKFNENNSSYGISGRMLPSNDFLTLFEYIDGDYRYINDMGKTAKESELLYLTYNKDDYELAKSYAFEHIKCSETNIFTYKEYVFAENITNLADNPESPFEFPYIFNMIGYNDNSQTLIFVGFSIFDPTEKDEQLLTFEDMGAFLKEYFSFYDFDA